MTNIIDGKETARTIRETLEKEVSELMEETGLSPGLSVILVGEDPASKVYVRNKAKACDEAGVRSDQHLLPADTTEEAVLNLIAKLNHDPSVHGILVQLPLPDHIDEQKVIEAIEPEKDVDGFHPVNVGKLVTGEPLFEPCTPKGILRLLSLTGVDLTGKEAIVVGRSNIVGKPVALMLLKKHATVTICHSRTKDLADKVRAADVVVAAVGRAEFIKGDWIKDGAIVIDVGINRTEDGKLVGDVEFEAASKHAAYITPVPGGVGPMTIAMLLENTVESAKRVTPV